MRGHIRYVNTQIVLLINSSQKQCTLNRHREMQGHKIKRINLFYKIEGGGFIDDFLLVRIQYRQVLF